MGPLSVEQVLAAEATAIHDLMDSKTKAIVDELHRLAAPQDREEKRADKDADTRSGTDENRVWVENRKRFYCELNKLRRAALCCSGGGIRSATFCLGIIQALAKHNIIYPTPDPSDTEQPPGTIEDNANHSFLSRFHYLSTVSGGGYIGSWLSAWRHRDDFPTVWQNMSTRPDGPDVEPAEISWLRAYSNYLTPKTGLLSADTWTGIAIYLRNLLLNWLVIIPAVAVVIVVLKIIVTISVAVARIGDVWWPHFVTAFLGIVCLIVAQRFTTRHRPTRRQPRGPANPKDTDNVRQGIYLRGGLIWSLFSALLITSALTSIVGVTLAGGGPILGAVLVGAAVSIPIFAGGWLAGYPYNHRYGDFWRWSVSGVVYGGMVALGACLYAMLGPYGDATLPWIWIVLLPVILGVPWVLISQLFSDMVFVGLASYEENSDDDREWLGRVTGWVAASAVIWIVSTFITFAGGYFLINYLYGEVVAPYIVGLGGVSGVIAAWLGKSGTASKSKAGKKGEGSIWSKIGLAVAGPVFAAVLVVVISVGLDKLLLGDSLIAALGSPLWTWWQVVVALFVGLAVALFVAWVASRNVNINRFSIHAIYRNRLMRAYLGASRQQRCPDKFTGFDNADNVKAAELWPPKVNEATGRNTFCLFHVVNITLNVVKTARLAWKRFGPRELTGNETFN